jgi:hypothetical protein
MVTLAPRVGQRVTWAVILPNLLGDPLGRVAGVVLVCAAWVAILHHLAPLILARVVVVRILAMVEMVVLVGLK